MLCGIKEKFRAVYEVRLWVNLIESSGCKWNYFFRAKYLYLRLHYSMTSICYATKCTKPVLHIPDADKKYLVS